MSIVVSFEFKTLQEAREALGPLFVPSNGHGAENAAQEEVPRTPQQREALAKPKPANLLQTGGGPKGEGSRKGKGEAAEGAARRYFQVVGPGKWVRCTTVVDALSQPRGEHPGHAPGTVRHALRSLEAKGELVSEARKGKLHYKRTW